MRRTACGLAAILLGLAPAMMSSASSATGNTPEGLWNREDGRGGIRIAACGNALCGHIVWLRDRDTPARIGQKVLYNMHRTAADTWTGSADNPEDGKTYAGSMTLSGSRLLTQGCVFGGLICQSVALTRPR